jgi:CBS domain-containing protein
MTASVRDVMTPQPTSIESNEMVVEAARRMVAENVGSLPVVQDGRLVGMVTDRDLVLHVLAKDLDPHKVPVSDVCTESPVTVAPDDELDTALQRMAKEQVRRLPVVDHGELVGILAQADVALTAHAESTGRLVEEISE